MTIASEITRIRNNIAAAYTALSDKGATLPATQDSANLADCVESVSSGETVYAINNTSETISTDDKVWLNKHCYSSITGSKYEGGGSSSAHVYFFDNNVPYRHMNSSKTLFTYGFNGSEFEDITIQTNLNTNGAYYCYYMGSQIVTRYLYEGLNNTTTVRENIINPNGISYASPAGSFYIGNDKIIKYVSYSSSTGTVYNIVEFNHATGVIGNVLGTINIDTTSGYYIQNLMIDGNTLVLYLIRNQQEGSDVDCLKYYDISDLSSISLIRTINVPESARHLFYMTGCGVGDYLFCKKAITSDDTGGVSAKYSTTRNRIYKIKSDYTLETAEDLPLQLQSIQNAGGNVRYDTKTKYLTVGTHDNIYFFEFDSQTKTFSEMEFSATLPTESGVKDDYAYVATLSEDKTLLAISYLRGGSSTYFASKLYKLVNDGDTQWYAEPYNNVNVTTITGVAKEDIAMGDSGLILI